MMQNEYRLVVLGMGYVGLTLAAVYARVGFSVLGVDTNETIVASLKKQKPHFHENGLTDLLNLVKEKLDFSATISPSNQKSVYVIAVGTSLDEQGVADYSQIDQSVKDIIQVIKKGDVVILRSTVVVGTTAQRVIPMLQDFTGLVVGKDIYVGFAPERTVEGKAIEELETLPQVVAGATKESEQVITDFFNHVSGEVVPIDSLESAEMIKLVSNAYRDISFAFANSVALAAAEHNVDVHELVKAANHGYQRNQIPLPSPGVGGYCLTKDPYLFAESSPSVGMIRDFMKAGRAINDAMPTHVAARAVSFIHEQAIEKPKVVIVGLAFKGEPATSDIRFSPSLDVIRNLKTQGVKNINFYDPYVSVDACAELGVCSENDLQSCAKDSDVIILMHGSQRYVSEDMLRRLKAREGTQLLIDTWSLYKDHVFVDSDGVVYANLSYQSK